jgi:hypothetical protein
MFDFNISDISVNKTENFLLHFPPTVWNYKDVSVRSSQGLGRACGVSRLLLHIPLLGVQERDMCVRSFKRALGCWVTILLHPPHPNAVGEQERGHARSKQADQVGRICRLVMSKWGENVKFLTSWLDRSVDGIHVKKWCTADPNDPQNAKCLVYPVTVKMKGSRILLPNSRVTELKRYRRAIQKQALEKGQLSQHQVGYFHPSFIFLSLVFLSGNPDDGRREESSKGEEEERN